MKRNKGEIGYINNQKLYRLLVTIGLFIIPAIIFISGLIYHGTKNNILTIVALVGCLPACRSTVGFIMICLQKAPLKNDLLAFQEHARELTMAYELVFTTYEKNMSVAAAVFHGNDLICYTTETRKKQDLILEHLEKMLKHNGYTVHVHVLSSKQKFLDRLIAFENNPSSLEERKREEKIRHIVYNLVL